MWHFTDQKIHQENDLQMNQWWKLQPYIWLISITVLCFVCMWASHKYWLWFLPFCLLDAVISWHKTDYRFCQHVVVKEKGGDECWTGIKDFLRAVQLRVTSNVSISNKAQTYCVFLWTVEHFRTAALLTVTVKQLLFSSSVIKPCRQKPYLTPVNGMWGCWGAKGSTEVNP